MSRHRLRCSQCIESGSIDAERFEHVYACGDAEHLSMGSLRSDSIPGFELQHHWQVCLKVAGMGHSVEQPLKHAVTDIGRGQQVAPDSSLEMCMTACLGTTGVSRAVVIAAVHRDTVSLKGQHGLDSRAASEGASAAAVT